MTAKRSLGFAELFCKVFAMVEGDCVDAVEDLQVEEECDDSQHEEEGNHEPRDVEGVRKEDASVADAEAASHDANCDESAELRGLLAVDLREVNLFRGCERTEIADRSIGEDREEKPAEGTEGDEKRWWASCEADDDEDQDEFDKTQKKPDDVLCQKDIAEASGGEKVKLDSRAVHAQAVVREDGDAEDRVCDCGREDEAAEAAAGTDAVGKEEDHEDGSNESVELVGVTAEIEELLLQAGGDGRADSEDARACELRGRGMRDCCASVWKADCLRLPGGFT